MVYVSVSDYNTEEEIVTAFNLIRCYFIQYPTSLFNCYNTYNNNNSSEIVIITKIIEYSFDLPLTEDEC